MNIFERAYYDEKLDAMVEVGEAGLTEWEHPTYYECEPGKLSVILFRGFKYERTFFDWREKIIADAWEKENARSGLLNTLLGHVGEQASQRDEKVAAEIVQWLGSNCGWCFLENIIKQLGYKLERELNTENPAAMAEALTKNDRQQQVRAKRLITVQYWCYQNTKRYERYKGKMKALLEEKFKAEIRRKVENIDDETLWQFQGSIELEDEEIDWHNQQTIRLSPGIK